jgi:hypothetical protein
MNTGDKERANSLEKAIECAQQFEPSSLPPPYVDPVPISARQPPSSIPHNEFNDHPGSRGKPAEDDSGEVPGSIEGEEAASDNGDSKAAGMEEGARNHGDVDWEYVGVFRMDK